MVLTKLNSLPLYILSGLIILFVIGMSVFFLVRAWKAGIAMGLDKTKLKRAVTSSFTFTLIPSISILLGVIALAGTLGVPLPWLRLSVIGALHYETSVADIAARSIGMSGLNATEMTLNAFVTIGLLLAAGIIWGLVFQIFLNKPYLNSLKKRAAKKKKSGPSFGDTAMTAMFVGLAACYAGSYIGIFTDTGNIMPLAVLLMSAAAMAVFAYFIEKKHMLWLENFSIAGSMLAGMAGAVLLGMIL